MGYRIHYENREKDGKTKHFPYGNETEKVKNNARGKKSSCSPMSKGVREAFKQKGFVVELGLYAGATIVFVLLDEIDVMADACACGEGDCHALWMAIKNKECDKIFQDMGDGEGDMIGRCSNELISKGHRGGQVFADKLRAKIKKECDKRKEKP